MSELPPTLRAPTREEIRSLAATHHIELTDEELDDFATLIPGMLEGYERLDELVPTRGERRYTSRDPGYKPDRDEDPLNAFVTKCVIEGADGGLLDGYEVGLKDNIAVAGVPMTAGSRLFDGFTPESDATVVTRLLDAGARITGKMNMEDMAFGGAGELSATGAVSNPVDTDYLAGGSSSGAAAAVKHGAVDVALGGDQGGSIRIPAAWCGVVGLKPTHGLVPYSGITGLGASFDHTGPLSRSVSDAGRVLEAIAGPDPGDPRQKQVEPQSYTDLDADPDGITIGVLEEGFEHDESEPGVSETVRGSLESLADAGAELTEVSIPDHFDAPAIWNAIVVEATASTIDGEGVGLLGKGRYPTDVMEAFGNARRAQANDYSPPVKLTLIVGQYLSDTYRNRYYAKAQNLLFDLTETYDSALEDVDVLAMPTTPQTAHEHRSDLSRVDILGRALNMLMNTAPFNVTGHPALSVPSGRADGLPVGTMLVGPRFDDRGVLEAGAALESVI